MESLYAGTRLGTSHRQDKAFGGGNLMGKDKTRLLGTLKEENTHRDRVPLHS
jgi:hypothetical protein